ncbi:MAG: hypothetical protein MUF83_17375 [Acidimicrobiales bacterium]|jgi:hypothetical protein|nr:hypothetical protein [Acidimicrobiales bacterium]
MAGSRKAIHAYLTQEAHDSWHDVAAEHGVSVSALLEAIGQFWTESSNGDGAQLQRDALVKQARRIDADRRRRARS